MVAIASEPYIEGVTKHTASEFSDSEWARFWRENGKQVTNYTSIFKGTIRKHEWRDNPSRYAAIIFDRQIRRAAAGTIRVHEFERGVSYEPPAERVLMVPDVAMACAIQTHDPFQSAH